MKFTIGQLLDRIQKGERMNEIVSEFGLLKKHFSEQLKENGYRGDRAGRYHWDHNTPEPLDFDLLDKYIERVEKFVREQNESFEEVTENKDDKRDNGDIKEDKPISAASNSQAIAKKPLIQFVEEKKQEQAKIYRGYYLEPHVAAVMDKIQNKSEVANIALERFFKEQGLL